MQDKVNPRVNYRLILGLVLALLVAAFVMQNTAVIEVRFLFWTASMSRVLMFLILIGIGIAIGWFLHGHLRGPAARR